MGKHKIILSAAILGVLAVVTIGLVEAQQRGGRGGGRGGFDPEQMRQRQMERMKEILAPGEGEWEILEPRLEKVMTQQRESAGAGGMMRMMMGRGGRGGGRGDREGGGRPQMPGMERTETATSKAMDELQTALEDEKATPEQIKAKLTALRVAREAASEELAKARESLREVCTIRQEANLVLMGYLD